MGKTIKKMFKKQNTKAPKFIHDIIPIKYVYPDGIFLLNNGDYSLTYRFTDINYTVASEDDQLSMFKQYMTLLNSFDSTAQVKITINQHRQIKTELTESILMPMKGDGKDKYRKEYNSMLEGKTYKALNVTQEKYITVCAWKKSYDDAVVYFNRIEALVRKNLNSLNSKITPLSAGERLKIFYDFYRPGEEAAYNLDLAGIRKKGYDVKDYICPDAFEKDKSYVNFGGQEDRFCRVFYLKDYATYLSDDIIHAFMRLPASVVLSVDFVSVPPEEAVKEVENRLLGVESNITRWQQKQNKTANFSATVPYDMELEQKETREFLSDLQERDQKMMLGVVTIAVCADSMQELESVSDSVKTIAMEERSQIACLKYRQVDGLNTVLPYGTCLVNEVRRTLLTESVAAFMPFNVQEVLEKGGIYFGENAVSHNLILCNRENLLNQSMMITGVPGSGKSFITKELLQYLILNTDDDILICDPDGEYDALISALGGTNATIAHIKAGGTDRINAMAMSECYGDSEVDSIAVKSQFIMSIMEQVNGERITAIEKSIIDRCVKLVFNDAKTTGKMPTLMDLRNKLAAQKEDEAEELALKLEVYTTGSLDLFGNEGTIDLSKRIVSFNIYGLGKQLKPAGLLVMTDTILNRVSENWRNKKRTHIFIDEFQVVYENEHSAEFFSSAWRQFRKRNAFPTAITQNVDYLLRHGEDARSMLSNSEFLILLNQSANDREQIAELLSISEEQLSYVTSADAGSGLIRYGGNIVPFINQFPRDTELYKLMTTKAGEWGSFNP